MNQNVLISASGGQRTDRPTFPPFEFENWAVIALGGIPNKVQVGDMGVDGRIFFASMFLRSLSENRQPVCDHLEAFLCLATWLQTHRSPYATLQPSNLILSLAFPLSRLARLHQWLDIFCHPSDNFYNENNSDFSWRFSKQAYKGDIWFGVSENIKLITGGMT